MSEKKQVKHSVEAYKVQAVKLAKETGTMQASRELGVPKERCTDGSERRLAGN